jgi:cytoskeletal protein CcmA (bactofilin family)
MPCFGLKVNFSTLHHQITLTMFSKNGKNAPTEGSSVNLISSGTSIIGDIKSNGDFRIDGTLKGTIIVKGKLVVGPTGVIEGEVECQNADISGEVKGKINVAELLMLRASAKTNGDLFTGKISIEPEAQFTGTCNMGGVVKSIQKTSHEIKQSSGQKISAN